MIDQLLTDTIDVLKTYMLQLMLLGGAVVIYFFGLKIKDKLTNIWNKMRSRSSLSTLVKTDVIVNDLLVEIRTKYNADRAYVFQFHNGANYSNKNSILRFSCSHEKVAPGISSEQNGLQGLLVSKYADIINSLIHDGTLVIPNVEKLEPGDYKTSLMERGISGVLLCTFGRSKEEIEGFIGVDYCDNQKLPTDFERIQMYAARIGAALREKK